MGQRIINPLPNMSTVLGELQVATTRIDAAKFFGQSNLFDYLVTRELAHIRPNWELTWDKEELRYKSEQDSYADAVTELFAQLSTVEPPRKYHDNEDRLAEYLRTKTRWNLKKINGRWIGAPYEIVLQDGGFGDIDQKELTLAAAGRIQAAIVRGQHHFDDMEESHQYILSIVVIIILYWRSDK